MEQTERLVVHVEEAIRLGTTIDDAHLRLSLMLLDSAAELLMYRVIRGSTYTQRWAYDRAKQELDAATKAAAKDPSTENRNRVRDLKRAVPDGLRRLDKYFEEKCKFLVEHELLDQAEADALARLHRYRNETYHRDKLRPGTLVSSVRIYTYLVCTMMQRFPVRSASYLRDGPLPTVARFLAQGERFGMETQAKAGAILLEQAGLAEPRGIGEALSFNLDERLDQIMDDLRAVAAFYADLTQDDSWGAAEVLAGAHYFSTSDTPSPSHYTADGMRWLMERSGSFWPHLESHREYADALRNAEIDQVAAFAFYATVEDLLEPEEKVVGKFTDWISGWIEHMSDIARGK